MEDRQTASRRKRIRSPSELNESEVRLIRHAEAHRRVECYWSILCNVLRHFNTRKEIYGSNRIISADR